jgi:polygalacturonase
MNQIFLINAVVLACSFILTNNIYIITDFGAIPHADHRSAHEANAKSFISAILKANSTVTGERIVKVPKGTFYSFPMRMFNIKNVSIIIEGKLSASKLIKGWPTQSGSGYYEDFISCHSCSYLTIHGGGKIDGRGYHWWVVSILNDKKLLPDNNYRPHLIRLEKCTNIVIHDIVMKNSPQFHLKMDECYDAEIYNIAILVNTTAQINLLKKLSL